MEIGDGTTVWFGNTFIQEVNFEKPENRVHRDWLSMREMPAHVARFKEEAEELQLELIAVPAREEEKAKCLRDALKHARWKVSRLSTEPYRRWANGFSCFFFALVGIPVSMRYRFDSFLSSFFVCFLPILGVFYPLLMFQEELTTSGSCHPIFFWLADAVLLVAGLLLVRGVIRH